MLHNRGDCTVQGHCSPSAGAPQCVLSHRHRAAGVRWHRHSGGIIKAAYVFSANHGCRSGWHRGPQTHSSAFGDPIVKAAGLGDGPSSLPTSVWRRPPHVAGIPHLHGGRPCPRFEGARLPDMDRRASPLTQGRVIAAQRRRVIRITAESFVGHLQGLGGSGKRRSLCHNQEIVEKALVSDSESRVEVPKMPL